MKFVDYIARYGKLERVKFNRDGMSFEKVRFFLV